MADIAQLGIEIDSRGAKKATGDLNTLAGAATKAEGATDRLEASADGASAANKRLGASASSAAAQVNKMAANQNSAAARMGGSFSGLAAQAQDIGVTAAMGMNPMIIGLQQGTQIAGQMQMAMQSGASAASVFGTAIRSLISPISLASIGLAAIVAAGIQMVNWPHAAASALDFLANNLENIVTYGGYAAGALALMYSPAILGGIATVTTAVWGLGTAAVGAAYRFIAAWAAAAGPFTLIIAAIAAVVAAVYIFRDEIATAIGVDVIREIKRAGNYIIGSFVGAYDAVIATWKNLPAAMADLLVSATNAVIGQVEMMINKAIRLINKFINGISDSMKNLPGMEMFGGLSTVPEVSIKRAPNLFRGAASKVGADIQGAFSNAYGTDYIGALGGLSSKYIGDAKQRIMGLADSIRKMGDEVDKAGQKAENAYRKIVNGARSAIAANQAELAGIGLSNEAALKLKYTQDLLNKAKERGIALSTAQKTELTGLAGQMSATEVAVQKLKDAYEFSKDVTKGFFLDMASGLREGKGLWESFGNAAMNVLNRISDKLLDLAVDGIFTKGSGGGGIGSAITGVFSKILGMGYASGGYTGNSPASKVAGVVHGGEYVFSKPAVDRIGRGNLEAMHNGRAVAPRPANSNNQSNIKAEFKMALTVNGSGDQDILEKARVGAERQMSEALDQFNRKILPGRVQQIQRNPNRRG